MSEFSNSTIKNLTLYLLVIIALFMSSACAEHSTYKNGVFENKHTVYKIKSPGKDWVEKNIRGTNIAFWNEKLAAFIMINSTCDEYRDAPVDALAKHLFIGIEKKEFVLQTEVPISGRDAVYTELTGKVDGAPVSLAAYTLVKNYCTYDIGYSAPPDNFEKGLHDFHNMAKRFKVIKRK